jgi:hypothetical protein
MVPNVTHGSGFHGLLAYLLTDKGTGLPRAGAHLIGGTLTGQTVSELSAEFGLIRRLRPNADKVVLHHSLSYAPGENPSDEQIRRDADRYFEHMGLADHPKVYVVHRDKECVHVHVPASKIGAHGEWFDARLDMPHSQVAAGLVEREFGLVEVPRPHKQKYIDEAWTKIIQERPELARAKAAPAPADMSEKGVAKEIQRRLQSIPGGLTLPEWVEAAEIEGIQLQPNISGGGISGWNAQLRNTDTAHMKLSKTGVIWSKLLESGKVFFDPAQHLDFAKKLKEIPFAKPASADPAPPLSREENYPRNGVTLHWDWQPHQPVPAAVEQGLVAGQVVKSPRPRARRPGLGTPGLPSVRRPQEAAAHRPRLGASGGSQPDVAAALPAALGAVQRMASEGRPAYAARHGERVGHRLPLRRPRTWLGSSADLAPPGPGSGPGLHDHRQEAPGPAPIGDLHREPVGRVSPAPGGGRGGSTGSGSVSVRADRRSLAHVIGQVARFAMAPFKALIDKLTKPKQPEPPRLSQAEAIKKALASPILGLSGKPPRSIATVEVLGPGPAWFQERERRRRQAEESADRRQEQRFQKEAAERAAKIPGKPQGLPEDDSHPDVGGGIKHKH